MQDANTGGRKTCDINYSGSAAAMEPKGTLEMFRSSLNYKTRYTKLISDGDSKTHALLLEEQPYGPEPDVQVQKMDCVGHVQKRMGTALRNLTSTSRMKVWYMHRVRSMTVLLGLANAKRATKSCYVIYILFRTYFCRLDSGRHSQANGFGYLCVFCGLSKGL